MEYLDQEYFGNPVRAWLLALGIAIAALAIVRLLKALFVRSIAKLTPTTFDGIQDLLGNVLGRTKFLLIFAIAVSAGSSALTLAVKVERFIGVAATIAALFQIGLWGNAIISHWIGKIVQRKIQHDAAGATTMTAMGFLGRVILWAGLLLFALDNLGVNITGLAAGIGIGGIAIALAVQSILGDLFASLSIVLDKPFVIGDFIIVDEFLGTVEHIGLKTTRVRSLSGEQLVFSNADLLKSRIRNYKRMFERRVIFELGVTYQTPLEKVSRISGMIRSIIESQPKTRFDRAHFRQFGDSALIFEAVYYVTTPEYNDFMDTQERINLAIMKQFTEESIDFAYPTRTLFVHGDAVQQTRDQQ